MPANRFGLGAAEFELILSNEQFLRTFAEGQAQARLGSKKIADAIDAEMKRAEGSFARVEKAGSFKLNLKVDTAGGEAAIKRLQQQIGSIKSAQVLNLTIKGDQAEASLARIRQSITAAEKRGANIEVKVDTRQAERQVSRLQELLKGALRGGVTGSGVGGGLLIGAGFSAATGAAVAVQGLTQSLIGGTKAGIDYNAQLQTTQNTFTFFSKNAEDAGRAVSELRKLAAISPFGEQPILQAGATFLRVSQGDVDRALQLTKLTTVLAAAHPELGFEAMQAAIQQLVSGDYRAFEDRTNVAFGTVKALADQGVTGMELYRRAVLAAGGSMALLELNAKGLQAQSTTLNAEIARIQGLLTQSISDRLPGFMAALTEELKKDEPTVKAMSDSIGTLFDVIGGANQKLEDFRSLVRQPSPRSTTEAIQGRIAPNTGDHSARDAIDAGVIPLPPPESDIDKKQRLQGEGDAQIKELHRVAKARGEEIDKQLESERRHLETRLKILDEEEKAELGAIEKARKAALDANKAAIDNAQREQQAKIKALETTHDAAVRLLDAEANRLQHSRETEDRDRQATRTFVDRTLADHRGQEDRIFDAERTAAIKSLKDQEEQRSRSVAAQIKDLERLKDVAIRGLEQEAETARDTAQADIRAIEERSSAEDRRHQRAMVNLNAEEARQLGAIDKRLAALDTADRKAAEAERDAQLSEAKSRASRGLSAALRVGNPAAIVAARKALAEAEAAIQKEQAGRQGDAIRRRLAAEQDSIRKEFDARKAAEDKQHQRRKQAFDEEKQQISDTLDAALEAIGIRKQKVEDDTKAEIEGIREKDQVAKDAYDTEVERTNTAFDLRKQRRDADRLEEDRRLADGRLLEDQTLADGRRAQDEDIKLRREAADLALKADRDAVDESYNGPDGILTNLHKATDAINDEFRQQSDAAKEKYDKIRDDAKANFEQITASLTTERDLMGKELDKAVADWEKWKTGTIDQINGVINKIDDLIKKIGEIGTGDGTTIEVKPGGGGQALPSGGGNLAYGPVVRNATDDSYWTSGGTHGGHPAADIFAPSGSPIYSPVDGSLDSYRVSQGGNAATLKGADGRAYYFAHGKVPFESGSVKRGEQIGQVGNSGNAEFTASHLHFAISEHGAEVFDRYNGSGDVTGDPSYWGSGGTGLGQGDGDWIDVTLFGKKYRILVENGTVPGEVGAALRKALAAAGKPRDWEYPLGEIAAVESGERNSNGSVVLGTGNFRAVNPEAVNGQHASGLMQMLPSTFEGNRVRSLPDDVFDRIANPASASNYIAGRYKTPWGTNYFRSGHMDWRGVPGYATGGPIPEPTLLYGMNSQRVYAKAGEDGKPEHVSPGAWDGGGERSQPLIVQVNLDGRTIAEVSDPHLRAIASHGHRLRNR